MAHNSGYTKVWDPAGTAEGLGIHEVARCLGTSKRDIGGLCTSALINKWAKYKPQAVTNMVNKYRVLTLAERQDDNYGFDTASFFSENGVSELFTKAESSSYDWTYKSRVAPYRLLDFSAVNSGSGTDGYNHSAIRAYHADGGITIPSSGTVSQQLYCYEEATADAEIFAKDLSGILEEETWYIGLFKKHGSTYEFESTGHTIASGFSSGYEQVTTDFQLGETTTFWGAANAQSVEDMDKCFFFPNTKAVIKVETPVTNRIWIVPNSTTPFEYSGTASEVDSVTGHFDISNNSGQTGTYNLTVELAYSEDGETFEPLDSVSTGSTTISSGAATRNITLNGWSETIQLSKIYIKAYYTWSVAGNSGTWGIDCINKTPSSSLLGWQKLESCL